ncbi:MAG: hypothetical protein ABSB49_19865 [Polyangia bacterium]
MAPWLGVVLVLATSCGRTPLTLSGSSQAGGAGTGGATFQGGSGGVSIGTGGGAGTGGAIGAGSVVGSGGVVETGGVVGTSGMIGIGGATGPGGASTSSSGTAPPTSVKCADTSTTSASEGERYGTQVIPLDGNYAKNYVFQANWWGSPYDNQSENISGLGFTVTNPGATTSNPSDPLGFPSIYIGFYQGTGSMGSNLPKLVRNLTSIPTIFSVDATSDTSSLNATCDLWFAQSSAGVTGGTPGFGGAELMVWLFKPSDKQPRGSTVLQGYSVGTVPGYWSVWYDPTNNGPTTLPCVSYVSSEPLSELAFDLNDFITDAVSHNWGVTSSQYLSIIFAGTQIWSGGDGFQVKQFCANVE